jgi:hypothetical protein
MTKLKIPFVHIGGRTHDYQILGHKFEVKTQNCSTYPQPHYDCDVADHNYEKQVVNYIFTRARSEGHVAFESYHTVYIVGCCTRLMFEEHCAHKRQDEISNKLKFHNPCRTIEIKRLKPLHLLPTLLEEPCNRSSL